MNWTLLCKQSNVDLFGISLFNPTGKCKSYFQLFGKCYNVYMAAIQFRICIDCGKIAEGSRDNRVTLHRQNHIPSFNKM